MSQKVLLTLFHSDIAPRFDLTPEVLIASLRRNGEVESQKTIVLTHASAEELCHLILTENVEVVICGGIEEEYFEYLTWKKIQVIDSVMGPWERALEQFSVGRLEPSSILFERNRK